MQGRSWMAALTVNVATVLLAVLPTVADDKPPTNKVRLDLRIAGLRHAGCDVEIKPGNSGCRFRPVTHHVESKGEAFLVLDDVTTLNADRECAFAITIREPGQPPRTVRRGLRLDAPRQGISTSTLTCFLDSPSRISVLESPTTQRK